jgi:hypothetical protein
MNSEVAEYVRGKCRVIAVSDAYRLAPWADALVSNDSKWWRVHPEALKFKGRKFCGMGYPGCERIKYEGRFTIGLNSGLQAMRVAVKLGASRLLLLGFDMHATGGAHFFGEHPAPLQNTKPGRFNIHIHQFDKWEADQAVNVINCTPGSALLRFPLGDVRELLGA